jgi:hypothetical protein
MDDEKINEFIIKIGQQMLDLQKHQVELLVAVNVLKGLLALQMYPDDPIEGAKQIRDLEATLLSQSDPNRQERQEVSELIQALKDLKKMGHEPHEA